MSFDFIYITLVYNSWYYLSEASYTA